MGYHIGLLIMAALHYLAPEFIEEGRLCWLHAPLYIVEQKNGKEQYFFSDEEFNKVRGFIRGEVHRNKGLGEMDAESARRSMFTEEYQRMEIITPSPDAVLMLEELMGKNNEPRREYVFTNIDFSEIRE